ncbi:TonB-dependent receptor [Terriglobus tenax]|uniref:TonB-dependent receptor n=1 Tax=Terriglobus tenax TaxID=1111115 RepID=UPI0021E05F30|nr:TonB-dependent receptor [Terriglobus tenax]
MTIPAGRVCAALLAMLLSASAAHAVVVRGRVTNQLGAGVAGARVQLLLGRNVVATAVSGTDGEYEVRSSEAGRFLLLTGSPGFATTPSQSFYGGRLDVLEQNVALRVSERQDEVTVTATGLPTTLSQTNSSVSLIQPDALWPRYSITEEMRLMPGVQMVQSGQMGGQTSQFVRGGQSDGNRVTIDGIPAEDMGGRFDYGNLSSFALDKIEVHRGPDSVTVGSGATASAVRLATRQGTTIRPVLNYTGDAGNFHTWRNQGDLSGTARQLDYLLGFSRVDSSNALPGNRYHNATSAANIGLALGAKTSLRFTLRNTTAAVGVPNAHDFFGISDNSKQADQILISGISLDHQTTTAWHNLVRYGVTRKREQLFQYSPVGTPVTSFGYTTYYGNVMTIAGANGYSATGRAAMDYDLAYPTRSDQVSNRDQLYYQTDFRFSQHLAVLGAFRYEDERGIYKNSAYGTFNKANRGNYGYTLQMQGDFASRVFYSLGGEIEKNALFGLVGVPKFGIAWYPVAPGNGFAHGTKVRFNFSKGVQEPTLTEQFSSLYQLLINSGNTAAISTYHVTPMNALRSRSYEGGVEQSLLSQRGIIKLSYFHTQFDHQIEYVDAGTLINDFGIPSSIAYSIYGADLNSLAYRAQGLEAESEWKLTSHWFARGGYTFLDATVQRSLSGDAVAAGLATTNPNLPGIAIGATSPLVGQRPFRRPTHSGFFALQWTQNKWSAALKGALVGRSDDSTFLSYSDINGGNTLLLPNKNLDYAYQRIDANVAYQWKPSVNIFTQLDNLTSQQRTGPIGYPGLPFTFRAGIKLRLVRD